MIPPHPEAYVRPPPSEFETRFRARRATTPIPDLSMIIDLTVVFRKSRSIIYGVNERDTIEASNLLSWVDAKDRDLVIEVATFVAEPYFLSPTPATERVLTNYKNDLCNAMRCLGF